MSDMDFKKSTSEYVFTLGGVAISWRSIKLQSIADSTTKVEYEAAPKAAIEVVWLKTFLLELGVFHKLDYSLYFILIIIRL